MIIYRTYAEDVTLDQWATERGFLHTDNRTRIYYMSWMCTYGSAKFIV